MPSFTHGTVAVQYLRSVPGVDLEEIRRRLIAEAPDVSSFAPGWGTINDDISDVGSPATAPNRSPLPMMRNGDGFPDRLLSRLYFWVPMVNAQRMIDSGIEKLMTQRLQVCDVMFVERSKGQMLIVCSTRNIRDFNQVVVPTIKQLLSSIEDDIELTIGYPELQIGNHDLYLWLLERQQTGPAINPQLNLAEIRHISCRDAHMRSASLDREVDVSRRELLALVTNPSSTFGPAKLRMDFYPSSARLDFELHLDGGFAVHSERTHYQNIVDKVELRLQAMQELVFTVVPAINAAYATDADWLATRRAEFVRRCEEALTSS